MTRRPRPGRRVAQLVAAAGTFFLAALPAGAGVVADLETRNLNDGAAKVEINRWLVEGDAVRFDHLIGGVLQTSVIYRDRVGLVVDHPQKSYQLVDDQSLAKLAAHLKMASAAVDAKLSKLPPEHHALFVQSLKAEAELAKTTELEATAEEADQGGYASRKYRFSKDGQVVREVWATPWEKLGKAGKPLQKALADLAELFRLMGRPYAEVKSAALGGQPIFASPPHLLQELARVEGFPVAFTVFRDGKPVTESRLRSLEERPLDKSEFDPPPAFQRKETLK